MEHSFRSNARWLWLGAFTAFAIAALAGDRLLLASGMLLLGVFAFHNNPLGPASDGATAPALVISWVSGLFGVVAVVAAGVRTWL